MPNFMEQIYSTELRGESCLPPSPYKILDPYLAWKYKLQKSWMYPLRWALCFLKLNLSALHFAHFCHG